MNIQQSLPKIEKIIQTPIWNDVCGHGQECYVGSFQRRVHGLTLSYDVYVHASPIDTQDVCIRYGSQPHEYMSPGTILDLLASGARNGNKDITYLLAFDVISKAGKIRWTRNQ